jgi:hypothetical protein
MHAVTKSYPHLRPADNEQMFILIEINDINTIKKRLLRHDCSSQDTDLTNRGVDFDCYKIRKKNLPITTMK